MEWLSIIILGIIQGISEFLPVSSSGHLVVAVEAMQKFGGEIRSADENVLVNILLHGGTLASILVFYGRRIWHLLTSDRRVIGLVIVGTVPAVAVGLPVKMFYGQILDDPLLTGFMFLATGGLLIWAGRAREGELEMQDLSFGQAFAIGLCQTVAILPGLSRSGWTIAGGLLLGMRRESATTFSFLLAIPAIGGAMVLALKDLLEDGAPGDASIAILGVGTLVAFVVGLASLAGLIKIVQRGRLAWFAWYLIPLGIAVVVWQLSVLSRV